MFRRKGKETASETFHRDVGIFCDEFRQMPHFVFGIYFFFKNFFLKFFNFIFLQGGWINLDTEDQFFSCIPGTANMQRGENDPIGFAEIKPNKLEENKLQAASTLVRIG